MFDTLFVALVVAVIVAAACALAGTVLHGAVFTGLGLVAGFAAYHVLIARKGVLNTVTVPSFVVDAESVGRHVEAAVKRYFDEARGVLAKAEAVVPAVGTLAKEATSIVPAVAVVAPEVEKALPVVEGVLPEAEAALKVLAPVVAAVV